MKDLTASLNIVKNERRKIKDDLESSAKYKKLVADLEATESLEFQLQFLEADKEITKNLESFRELENNFSDSLKKRDKEALSA